MLGKKKKKKHVGTKVESSPNHLQELHLVACLKAAASTTETQSKREDIHHFIIRSTQFSQMGVKKHAKGDPCGLKKNKKTVCLHGSKSKTTPFLLMLLLSGR